MNSDLTNQQLSAIDNIYLLEDLQHSNQELTLAYDVTIESLAHSFEMHEPRYTAQQPETASQN